MRHYMGVLLVAMCLSGCAVVTVADMAVSTAATVVKTGVKAVGSAVDGVTSLAKSSDEEKKPE